MNSKWPTQDKDMQTAQLIMENYAEKENSNSLDLLEMYVDTKAKKMSFRLSQWVVLLAKHFNSEYGASQGDYITRQVLTRCITKSCTIH